MKLQKKVTDGEMVSVKTYNIEECLDKISDISYTAATDDDIINVLYETGIINPVMNNIGKIFLAADGNILTL